MNFHYSHSNKTYGRRARCILNNDEMAAAWKCGIIKVKCRAITSEYLIERIRVEAIRMRIVASQWETIDVGS